MHNGNKAGFLIEKAKHNSSAPSTCNNIILSV